MGVGRAVAACLLAVALLCSRASAGVRELPQRDLRCALEWAGWTTEAGEGLNCGTVEEGRAAAELFPCGVDGGESRVLVVGDSLTRDLFVLFLELLELPIARDWDDYKGHRSFDVEVREGESKRARTPLPVLTETESETPLHWREPPTEYALLETPGAPCGGIVLSFRWAPFLSNVSRVLNEEGADASALVIGAGLWDLLHIHGQRELDRVLAILSHTIDTLLDTDESAVWIQPGMMEKQRMLTDEKKRYLTNNAVNSFLEAFRTAFAGSQTMIHTLSLRETMSMAESLEPKRELTTDGVHPPPDLLRAIVPPLLEHWARGSSVSFGDQPLRLRRLQESEEEKDVNPPPPPTQGFIGGDPLYGALVGLYFLLMFLTGDVLIVSGLILWVLEPQERSSLDE